MQSKLFIRLKRFFLRWINIQRVIRYFLLDSFVFLFPAKQVPRTLLIIRLEGIGDYLLFRNFIEVLAQSDRFNGYRITLCGSTSFQELALFYDKDYISDFIGIDVNRFKSHLFYRWKILRTIRTKGFEILLYPTYSRETITGDSIARISGAVQTISCIGDHVHAKPWERKIFNKFYTQLIDISEYSVFEFSKNLEFISKLLHKILELKCPTLAFQSIPPSMTRYAVLCPGSLLKKKRWPFERFICIADILYQRYRIESILVGGKNDYPFGDNQNLINERPYIQNNIGVQSLTQTAQVVQNSILVITNDTSVGHIGVMLSKPTIIISNGEHYGRFTEYPKEIHSAVYYCYPPAISYSKDTFITLVKRYQTGSWLHINDISINQVVDLIEQVVVEMKLGYS